MRTIHRPRRQTESSTKELGFRSARSCSAMGWAAVADDWDTRCCSSSSHGYPSSPHDRPGTCPGSSPEDPADGHDNGEPFIRRTCPALTAHSDLKSAVSRRPLSIHRPAAEGCWCTISGRATRRAGWRRSRHPHAVARPLNGKKAPIPAACPATCFDRGSQGQLAAQSPRNF